MLKVAAKLFLFQLVGMPDPVHNPFLLFLNPCTTHKTPHRRMIGQIPYNKNSSTLWLRRQGSSMTAMERSHNTEVSNNRRYQPDAMNEDKRFTLIFSFIAGVKFDTLRPHPIRAHPYFCDIEGHFLRFFSILEYLIWETEA